jgi:hypothetical protein
MLDGLFSKGTVMKCGVRFCGGCNSRFDRGDVYTRIRKRLEDEISFEYAQEGTIYDVLLVIGGCTNCCASYSQFSAKHGIVKIYDSNDVEKTIQILKDFE